MRSSLRRDSNAANTLIVIIIVLLVVSSSALGLFLFVSDNGSKSTGAAVKSGDKIKVDYIGALSDGRVFDTSEWSVATDNATYPKSLFFSMRGNESTYTPLSFTTGQGSVITGFDKGVIGMTVGQTKTITILPAQGYGSLDQTKLVTFDLTQSISTYVTMSYTEFKNRTGETPASGLTSLDKVWGWDVQVWSLDSTAQTVKVRNLPVTGTTYHIYGSSGAGWGWNATVQSNDGTTIVLKHLLTAADALKVKGTDSSKNKVMIETVDEATGKVTMSNDQSIYAEQKGHDMVFTVTLISIG